MPHADDEEFALQVFALRRDGMIHAMEGGLWLHRHVWRGRSMAHVVSTDRVRLLVFGRALGLPEHRLQFKPLKDPRTAQRRDAWHWDLGGPALEAGERMLSDGRNRPIDAAR
jgi:hypothetical protein